MKKILVAIMSIFGLAVQAQTIDSAARLASTYFKEAEAGAGTHQVWPVPLYGPMLFVDLSTRVAYANMPDSAGALKPAGDIYEGILPNDVLIANTTIVWGGRKWAVMLWPLPTDRDDRVNLMLHESFHRIQQQLGLPMQNPTVGHLGTMNGRIYFMLELRALEAALKKHVDQRAKDLENALIFREKRRELFPSTFGAERELELGEGLPEYTGMILGRSEEHILPHLYATIDTAENRKSLIRAAAYITGPVYGYLLYQKSPAWTLKVDSNSDLPALIAHYYHILIPKKVTDAQIVKLEKEYHADDMIATEKLKEEKRLQLVAQYTDFFIKQPALTITLSKMHINFNPNTLFDLGGYGTVYPTAEIRDEWGHLTVTATGMLMKDWHVVTLSAAGITSNGNELAGNGWKIILNDGWKLRENSTGHFELVKE